MPYKRDKRNANRGTDRGREALKESLDRLGAGRSIVVDKEGNVIAGNKTLEAAQSIGLTKTVEVETDGQTLVVVKRTDLDLDKDIKARELAFADNRIAELDLNWDMDVLNEDLPMLNSDFLAKLWTDDDLNPMAMDVDSLEGGEINTNYNRSVASPCYAITGEKPEIPELFDNTVTEKLVKEINESNLPDAEKAFLRIAAQRHTVLNFKKIAEYYAHADKELQTLMENNALIIIDFNRAIELGLVELTKRISALTKEEYGDDDI
jgi:hypothetical protein